MLTQKIDGCIPKGVKSLLGSIYGPDVDILNVDFLKLSNHSPYKGQLNFIMSHLSMELIICTGNYIFNV